jgi:hypothetical protein
MSLCQRKRCPQLILVVDTLYVDGICINHLGGGMSRVSFPIYRDTLVSWSESSAVDNIWIGLPSVHQKSNIQVSKFTAHFSASHPAFSDSVLV